MDTLYARKPQSGDLADEAAPRQRHVPLARVVGRMCPDPDEHERLLGLDEHRLANMPIPPTTEN